MDSIFPLKKACKYIWLTDFCSVSWTFSTYSYFEEELYGKAIYLSSFYESNDSPFVAYPNTEMILEDDV